MTAVAEIRLFREVTHVFSGLFTSHRTAIATGHALEAMAKLLESATASPDLAASIAEDDPVLLRETLDALS